MSHEYFISWTNLGSLPVYQPWPERTLRTVSEWGLLTVSPLRGSVLSQQNPLRHPPCPTPTPLHLYFYIPIYSRTLGDIWYVWQEIEEAIFCLSHVNKSSTSELYPHPNSRTFLRSKKDHLCYLDRSNIFERIIMSLLFWSLFPIQTAIYGEKKKRTKPTPQTPIKLVWINLSPIFPPTNHEL